MRKIRVSTTETAFTTKPSDPRWLEFIRCLAEDDAKALGQLRGRLTSQDWIAFLTACDSGVLVGEGTHDVASLGSGASYKLPSNPFFAAMFYCASNCLIFMREASYGIDLLRLEEGGLTAYHMLFSAMRFITDNAADLQLTDQADSQWAETKCRELTALFHNHLFSCKEQQAMMHAKCSVGMTPFSWGVFLGLPSHVERVLLRHLQGLSVQVEVVGVRQRVSLNVSEFIGENTSFFTCPISVLLDIYGQRSLAEVKAAGMFRNGFLWQRWVEALYHRNRWLIRIILALMFMVTCATVVFSGPALNVYLYRQCNAHVTLLEEGNNSPTYSLIVFCIWIAGASCSLLLTATGVLRKERFRFGWLECDFKIL